MVIHRNLDAYPKTITMNILFTFACLCISTGSFAQLDMFWNNYSNHNPAMSGFQYEQHGALSYSDYFRTTPSARPNRLIANYNIRLAEKHGLGVNYSGSYDYWSLQSYMVNYNYQFKIANAGSLSTGVGLGINRSHLDDDFLSPISTPFAFKSAQVNIGIAHRWKGLISGISLHALTNNFVDLQNENIRLDKPGFTIHSGYQFKLGEQFTLTPRAIFQVRNGYQNDVLSGDLTLTVFDKLSIGTMYTIGGGEHLGVHVGYDILEKFRLAYSYHSQIDPFGNQPSYLERGRHQFTFGFLLK